MVGNMDTPLYAERDSFDISPFITALAENSGALFATKYLFDDQIT